MSKTYHHEGRSFRALREDEVICKGDYLFCEVKRPRYGDGQWFSAFTTIGDTPAQCREDFDYSDFVWVREVDPLIVAMLKAKEKNK